MDHNVKDKISALSIYGCHIHYATLNGDLFTYDVSSKKNISYIEKYGLMSDDIRKEIINSLKIQP